MQRLHKYWVMPWESDRTYIKDRWYMRRQYSYSTIIPGPVPRYGLSGMVATNRARVFPYDLAVLMRYETGALVHQTTRRSKSD